MLYIYTNRRPHLVPGSNLIPGRHLIPRYHLIPRPNLILGLHLVPEPSWTQINAPSRP